MGVIIEAHAPRRIEIDLSKLTGIRDAAAQTREALLVDEEREEAPLPAAPAADRRDQPGARDDATGDAGDALQERGAAGCAPPHDGGAVRAAEPAFRAPTGGAPDDGAQSGGGPSPAEGDGARAPAAGAPARRTAPRPGSRREPESRWQDRSTRGSAPSSPRWSPATPRGSRRRRGAHPRT